MVMPLTEHIGKCPNGHDRYASMWEFVIDVATALKMPGFGRGGIPGVKGSKHEGKSFDLTCAWEYILRVFANAAMDAQRRGLIPAEIPQEDVEFVEKNYPIARFKDILPAEEWRAAAYGLARGGVFTRYEESFDERGISKRGVPGRGVLYLWSEDVAKTRNSITGEKFWGGPRYLPPATYAPAGIALQGAAAKLEGLHGAPIDELYRDYTLRLVFESGPLYTKHRSQFYYWIKAIAPENFAVINPRDAERMGIETGDVIRIETPTGVLEAPAVVEPTVREGVIMVPYGMGRWADTVVKKPSYFKAKDPDLERLLAEIPGQVEIPPEAVNPVRSLPEEVKKVLFTKSPAGYYNSSVPSVDEWRFNGVTPNIVEMADPSLGGWPLLSWLGAAQSYYYNVARVSKTGRKHVFKVANIVW